MKDEIKEMNLSEMLFNRDERLLDYIINLREEVNKLTAESTEWESKYYDLQEKLKEYKMLFDAFSKRPYAHRYLKEKKKELGNSKIIGLDSEMIYKDYYDLKEENERLHKELEKADSITQSCIFEGSRSAGKSYRQCLNWLEDYKSRIDKAIEYIEKYCEDYVIEDSPDEMCLFYKENGNYKPEAKEELLNILKGEDKYE